MSKISELSDGGVIQGGDTLIAVRSGGNVKVTYGGSTTANIDGGTIDGTTIGGTTPAAGNFTTGSFTGDVTFGDNDKAIFGAGSDLQIYHSGSASIIGDFGTGDLLVRGENLKLQNTAGENYLVATNNDATRLYHDNAEKLATTATGIDVTGSISADGAEVIGDVAINTTSPATYLHIVPTDGELNDVFEGFRVSRSTSLKASQFSTYSHAGGSATITSTVTTGSASGSFRVLSSADGSTTKNLLNISNGNDVSFYENTGTTAKFHWSAADERLGIGTSSPSASYGTLTVAGTGITINEDNAAKLQIGRYNASNPHSYIKCSPNSSGFKFSNASDTADLMVIENSGRVGIGTSSPDYALHVSGGATNIAAVFESTDADTWVSLIDSNTTNNSTVMLGVETDDMVFRAGGAERMRISSDGSCRWTPDGTTQDMTLDASGNLLVGTTSESTWESAKGFRARNSGSTTITRDGNPPLYVNRLSSDGTLLQFQKGTSVVGSIGTLNTNRIFFGGADTGFMIASDLDCIYPTNGEDTARDNAVDLGNSGTRFKDIYATNGTIQTSDRNEKQDIEALSEAEQRVAVACKGLLRKFRWKSSVADKGDEARIHFGIIAQDLQAAFEAEGLDAGRYGMFISTTWTDEETGEERTRMGVRYSELLAFIIAAI